MLTYSVALGDQVPGEQSISRKKENLSGWLLKKKRKRMQGWAKRWFSLSSTGVLSYCTSQGSVIRGSIQILVSTISYNPKLRQIHIDSGTMIYHLKSLTESDYDLWCTALKDIRTNLLDEVAVKEPASGLDFSILPTASVSSKRLSSRNSANGLLQLDTANKKMRAEIDHGIESAKLQQQNIISLLQSLEELKKYVVPNNEAVLQLFARLEQEKLQLLSGLQENLSQWQNVQNCLGSSHRRSGSSSPVFDQVVPEGAILNTSTAAEQQDEEALLHRTSSIYSSYSADQFFDAPEDIDLSGGEEEEYLEQDDDDESSSGEEDDSSATGKGDKSFLGGTFTNSIFIIYKIDVGGRSRSTSTASTAADFTSNITCVRRTKLPSPAVADAGSALSIFRKNVGKDLSTIAMPISMNEPLNMLQKACEELEYCELLNRASTLPTSMERLMYVVVFSISTYASSQFRTGRKPFNPMMTETYENIRPDKGFRFISEKVSHNPLVIAAHAEAKGFKYWQSTCIKSKFWGKSMEFMSEGTFHVTLTGHEDHYTFFKPSSWMKNMIAGEKYLEHSGECKVTNHTTGEYAIVTFKEGSGGGLFGAPTKRNDVVATLYDVQGKKARRVVGKWSESLAEEVNLDKSKLNVLWTAKPPGIQDYAKYFGFTKFATELNELTELELGKLPLTDTRLRPDQQLYEKGKGFLFIDFFCLFTLY